MSEILLIGFPNEEKLNGGTALWRGSYLDDILASTNGDDLLRAAGNKAVAYLAPKQYSDEFSVELNIADIILTDKKLEIKYSAGSQSSFKSSGIKSAIFKYLRTREFGVNNFPFCVAIAEDEFRLFIEDESILKSIRKLQSLSDWKGITKMFEPLDRLYEKQHVWNNPKILDPLGFACAKQSEVYINLKRNFRDENEKINFLKEKKRYREAAIRIRNRCIELDPDRPGYYSNLAYSHYQSVKELMTPGGRRDGNKSDEAKKFIEYANKALELDPNRITDLYRKGQILINVMAENEKFKMYNGNAGNVKKAKQYTDEGIQCYQRVEETFEVMPVIDEKGQQRYNKEYIKSLYNCASAYSSYINNDRDIMGQFISLKTHSVKTENILKSDSENMELAVYYMEKCIERDAGRTGIEKAVEIAGINGEMCGVYKLYNAGKIQFQRYNHLKNSGKADTMKALEALSEAGTYLKRALECKWPENLKRQNKGFIAERLARVYIESLQFREAMRVIEPFLNDHTDYYIRYTYAAAAGKCGEINKAKEQIRKAIESVNRNKELYLGYFLDSCFELKRGNRDAARGLMNRAITEAEKEGKKNLDTYYLTAAFIESRRGNTDEVIKLLEMAVKINPSRRIEADKYIKRKISVENFDLAIVDGCGITMKSEAV